MLPAFFDLKLRKWDTLENETLPSKSWSLRWIILKNDILMLSSLSYSLIEEITFLIFWRVFTLFCMSFVPVWIIIKFSLLTSTGLLRTNLSPIYILDHRIDCNKNFSLYSCHLIKLLSSLPPFIYSLLFYRSFYKCWFVYWSLHYW